MNRNNNCVWHRAVFCVILLAKLFHSVSSFQYEEDESYFSPVYKQLYQVCKPIQITNICIENLKLGPRAEGSPIVHFIKTLKEWRTLQGCFSIFSLSLKNLCYEWTTLVLGPLLYWMPLNCNPTGPCLNMRLLKLVAFNNTVMTNELRLQFYSLNHQSRLKSCGGPWVIKFKGPYIQKILDSKTKFKIFMKQKNWSLFYQKKSS